MKHWITICACSVLLLQACGQNNTETKTETKKEERKVPQLPEIKRTYALSDYLSTNADLDKDVDALFKTLDDTAIVAQLIMPAVGRLGNTPQSIKALIGKRTIGGVLMLNGTKTEFTSWITEFNELNAQNGNPGFLYSADAEPTLFNRKISGTPVVKKASEITSLAEVNQCADTIAANLKAIGINYNFAPVVDLAKNGTVGYRGFAKVEANNIPWSNAFIARMQQQGIIATAKHFPGHGLVSGDTHKSLQAIDGELKEVSTYPELIQKGVLSIMIGHLAVVNNPKYNTNGLPATCSKVIVTDLLRKELGFKGLVVTDAMNMGGVTAVKGNSVQAIEAGVDILLMPLDCMKSHAEILAKYRTDAAFKAIVDAAAKRVLRMKLCAGAIR
ncbi:glycoside hydrolase family 3 N-terminal domain-containing protein [Fluviicola sp.]|uniref:glycoside hydrolase family 3 N-terminal domain-containing protein n=1 Tax=Fluviicola sp. TaxID=1917219 RepID=UPI0031CF6CA9